jgi:outer membrane autotransporter protein
MKSWVVRWVTTFIFTSVVSLAFSTNFVLAQHATTQEIIDFADENGFDLSSEEADFVTTFVNILDELHDDFDVNVMTSTQDINGFTTTITASDINLSEINSDVALLRLLLGENGLRDDDGNVISGTASIVIDGSTVFDGSASDFSKDDLIAALNALGLDISGLFSASSGAEIQEQTIEETTEQTTRTAVRTTTKTITTRIAVLRAVSKGGSFRKTNNRTSSMTVNGKTGVSSGDGTMGLDGLAIWGDYSRSRLENDGSSNRFSGDTDSASIGLDYIVTDALIAGAIFGYSNTDINLETRAGDLDVKGYSLTGYGAYLVNANIMIDGYLGATRNDNDITESQLGIAVSGDYRSNRYSGGLRGSYTVYLGLSEADASSGETPLSLTGSLGYNYSHEKFRNYTDSNGNGVNPDNSSLGQGVLSGEAAYTLGMATGYLNVALENDFISPGSGGSAGSSDDNGGYGNIGLRLVPQDNLVAILNVGYQFGRSKEKERSFGASVRYSF